MSPEICPACEPPHTHSKVTLQPFLPGAITVMMMMMMMILVMMIIIMTIMMMRILTMISWNHMIITWSNKNNNDDDDHDNNNVDAVRPDSGCYTIRWLYYEPSPTCKLNGATGDSQGTQLKHVLEKHVFSYWYWQVHIAFIFNLPLSREAP